MNNNILIILVFIVPIGLLAWWFFKRKKKNSTAKVDYQKRRKDDEVWKTIKDYMKSRGEVGREIVECYVAKRLDVDVIDKKVSKDEQKVQKQEISQRKKDEDIRKKESKAKGLKYRRPLPEDLYVALFVTRNAKTKIEDAPRAIECSVINEKISKKETNRRIIVLKELNYEDEQSWVSPIKTKEEAEINKTTTKRLRNQQRFNKIKSVFSIGANKKEKLQKESEDILDDASKKR